MKEMCQVAVEEARRLGAEFADVRVLMTEREELIVRNDRVATVERGEDKGIGIRVLCDGAWGYCASRDLTEEGATTVAKAAVEIARASAQMKPGPVRLAPEPAHQAFYQTPIAKDPFAVPLEDKVALLLHCTEIILKTPSVALAYGWMSFQRKTQWFANSEGSLIEQILIRSGAGIQAQATDGSDLQVRSYPQSHGGQFMGKGYELVEELDLPGHSSLIAEEARALLSAPLCPEGEMDLVLDGSQLALQIHESVGHALELDRVLGMEANYAGTSFATLEKKGSFRYGSPLVHIVADATSPGGLATFGYDDEGVEAQSWHLIKEGILVDYLTSRETAGATGERRSHGCLRADGWQNLPIIRMVNISLLPGQGEPDDLINDVRHGVLMAVNRSWSIDNRRVQFQFGCEVGWEIKDGKKVRMVKNPCYSGITWEFWGSCQGIAGPHHWILWGVPNCGKGEPPQRAEMSHGAAPALFRKVKVFPAR
ncbi:MAG: TldD/PmbA family protein [Armatimonadetes bacterium]|nr:TldD/PmbA family protein [Armatimonadota bacterium]MDW8121549.1 TldD/PmbA family protein [Armatimonadota bacterium]